MVDEKVSISASSSDGFALAIPVMAKTTQDGYNVTFSYYAPNANAVYLAGFLQHLEPLS